MTKYKWNEETKFATLSPNLQSTVQGILMCSWHGKEKKTQQKQNTLHLPRTTTEQQVLRSYQFPWQHVRYTTSNISKTVTNLGAVISPYLGDGTGLETGKEDGKLRRGGGRTLYRKITNTYPNLSAGSKFFTSRHPLK